MRNTTKLKQILLKYNLDLSMEEDGLLAMTLVDKITGQMVTFEHPSYSQLIGKGYSHLLKTLKTDLGNPGRKTKSATDLPGL
jgi:hypothetical protein